MNLLNISGSPHVHSDESTKKIMWRVNLALVPALLVAIAYFGVNALLVSLISVASCVLFQWLIEKFILKQNPTIWDGSAIVTGLLLAFNVPATASMLWIVVIGALVAIVPANGTSVDVNMSQFSNGVYFFSIRQSDGTVSNQRVVVSH